MKDIAMHILDIFENSVKAESKEVTIKIVENTTNQTINLLISDNGKGMGKQSANKASDPFFTERKTRKVGMGLALLKQNVEQCGGVLKIQSELNKGTKIKACFNLSHIDCPPHGDISGVIAIVMTSNPEVKINFLYEFNKNQYFLDSFACQKILGKEHFSHPLIIKNLKEIIEEGLTNLKN